jgi:arylamine N-acetyltransferase
MDAHQDDFSLEDYWTRIGLDGRISRTPTFELLSVIVERHLKAVTFENLQLVMKRGPIEMSPAALQRKLVREKRGG